MSSFAIAVGKEQAESIQFHLDSALRAMRNKGEEGTVLIVTTDDPEVEAGWQKSQTNGGVPPMPSVIYFGVVFVSAVGQSPKQLMEMMDEHRQSEEVNDEGR